MLLPKLMGVAERAWAKDPEWATTKDTSRSKQLYNDAWSVFVNVVGKRELPKLDYLSGGFKYRIPTVGVVVKDGKVLANLQLPGLTIRYTTDGTKPTINSKIYEAGIAAKGTIQLKVFNATGRAGRTITIQNN
jgi:hexosaminidase